MMRRSLVGALLLMACGGDDSIAPVPDGSVPDALSADAGADAPVDVTSSDAAAPPFTTWPTDAVFYHVYVRSFADSNGDGIGDFAGLTSKLDYISSLGVDGILLLPIFKEAYSISGGYATVDFTHVTNDYGGDAAFDTFLQAAHAKKLKVMLDLSFTLVADQHPWFVAAKPSSSAPERAHFVVTPSPCPTLANIAGANGWNAFPDSQCYFSDYASVFPSLNYRDEPTSEAARVVGEAWLGRGVDGFRFDSAASIAQVDPAKPTQAKDPSSPATHAFWRSFMQRMKAKNPNSFAVAELFDHEADYYADGIDMAFQYLIYFGLVDGWTKHVKSTLSLTVGQQVAARPKGAMGGVFLGNHDVPSQLVAPGGRVADLVCPMPCTDVSPLRAAALLLFALPGTPFIYYGEELGLHGAKSVDVNQKLPWSRNPMAWDATSGGGFTSGAPWTPMSTDTANVAAQSGVGGSMLETYRGLVKVRRTSPALSHGTYREVTTSRPDVFAFLREDPTERVLVVASFASQPVSVTLDLGADNITAAKANERLFGGALPDVTPGNATAYPVNVGGTTWILLH